MQLIDLKTRAEEKRRFADGADLCDFWLNVEKERYRELRLLATRALTAFGSTYLCETSFSSMSLIKTKQRSCLTDENLEHSLRVALTSYEPRYALLLRNAQLQPSHGRKHENFITPNAMS
jgi:zinc finger BED domain-containing protein 5/7/8/9